jgi:hypothetical protein
MTTKRNLDITAICQLYQYIKEHGPLGVVRVSSAKARGKAKNYPYWGTAIYSIRVDREGHLTCAVESGASSDRRSLRLAEEDAEDLANSKGFFRCDYIGRIKEPMACQIIENWL